MEVSQPSYEKYQRRMIRLCNTMGYSPYYYKEEDFRDAIKEHKTMYGLLRYHKEDMLNQDRCMEEMELAELEDRKTRDNVNAELDDYGRYKRTNDGWDIHYPM